VRENVIDIEALGAQLTGLDQEESPSPP